MAHDRVIIFVRANSPGSDEAEWNDWYEKQHMAARLEMPGFFVHLSVSPERWLDAEPRVTGSASLSF